MMPFFLQEVHWSNLDSKDIVDATLGVSSFWSCGSSRSRGVAILVKQNEKVRVLDFETDFSGHFLKVNVDFDGVDICLVSVYLPTDSALRIKKIDELRDWIPHNKTVILGGDFNFVEDLLLDKRGGNPSFGSRGAVPFGVIKSTFGLVDAFRTKFSDKVCFSYSKNFVSCRLDRFYVKSSDSHLVRDVEYIPCVQSDHDFVYMVLDVKEGRPSRGKGYWKMDISLLDKVDNVNSIRSFISSFDFGGPDTCFDQWEVFKEELRDMLGTMSNQEWWSKHRHMITLKNKLQRLFNQLCLAEDPDVRCRYNVLKNDLSEAISEKFERARAWSRVQDFEEMDLPSKILFDKVQHRKSKTLIDSLIVNGTVVRDTPSILQAVASFYGELFDKDPSVCVDGSIFEGLSRLSDAEAAPLGGRISNDEIDYCLCFFNKNKTPGIDGLPGEFYHKFRDLLVGPLCQLFDSAFERGELPGSLKKGVITLICKDKDKKDDLNFYRPILLLNFDAKIFTRVLDLRLGKVIRKLVGPHQFFNWKGHPMDDAIRYLCDCVEYIKSRHVPGFLLSLDQRKAFDRVDHEFLFFALGKFGLGQDFIGWVRLLYYDIKSCVVVNGHLSPDFEVRRSVRQGCPLSPSLYCLAIEVFNNMILRDSLIKGISAPNTSFDSRVVGFANDSNHLVRDIGSVNRILGHFEDYSRSSGSGLNLTKSIGLAFNIPICVLARRTGLSWVTKAKILGVFLGIDDTDKENFWDKLDILHRQCSNMKRLCLTFRAKALVVNAMLLGKIMFVLRFVDPPRGFLSRVKSAIFGFVWSGRQHKIKDDTLCLPPEKGGIGIFDVFLRHDALRAKLGMSILMNKDVPWMGFAQYYLDIKLRALFEDDSWRWRTHTLDVNGFYGGVFASTTLFVSLSNRWKERHCLKTIYDAFCLDSLRPPRVLGVYPLVDFNVCFRPALVKFLDSDIRNNHFICSHGALPTSYYCYRWGSTSSPLCALCGRLDETYVHLFWDCHVIGDLKDRVLGFLGGASCGTRSISFNDVFFCQVINNVRPSFQEIAFLVCAYFRYVIWLHRNSVLFSRNAASGQALVNLFVARCRRHLVTDGLRLTTEEFADVWGAHLSFFRCTS